jgi:hypothetical protein
LQRVPSFGCSHPAEVSMALGQHIMLRLEDDRVLATSTAARRRLARCVLANGERFGLLAFRAADNHLHVEAVCPENEARELARRLAIALVKTLRLVVGFQTPRVKPIGDQWHLTSAFHYILRQEQHHGTDADPLFDASNLPDLLGMRLVGRYTAERMSALLPRVTRTSLLAHLGTPDLDAMIDAPWRAPLGDLGDAAAGAYGLVSLAGRSRPVVEARAAATHAARHASAEAIAAALGVDQRTARRLAARPPSLAAVRAVRLQLAHRAALRGRAGHSG